MQQIGTIWTQLDKRRQIAAALATVVVLVSMIAMARLAAGPEMTLLYSGLENRAASEVIQELEKRGVAYDLRNGTILVPSDTRDELRLSMAGQGLPSNGNKGYELLDGLTGFGTTSQMFDAAYWRAKEGELARTIVASSFVEKARVHIASTGSNPFQRSVEPTASVSILAAGSPVNVDQAQAIRYLVASAIAGMSAENVTVIDTNGGVVGASDEEGSASLQGDRSEMLRQRVLRLLEARVGPGNAVVEVSVATVTDTESIRELRLDPESRVVVNTDTEERSTSSASEGGAVTVASNLPDEDNAPGDGSNSSNSEARERVTYRVSETEREIIRTPGAVRRVSVAVLVNGEYATGDDGQTIFSERSEQELNALRDLVASAVGFDAERGDRITLKSMELPQAPPSGTVASSSWMTQWNLEMATLIKMALLSIVCLFLAIFVLRPILMRPAPPLAREDQVLPIAARTSSDRTLTGEVDHTAVGATNSLEVLPDEYVPRLPVATENAVDRLRALIGEREDETVEILRGWLEEKESAG